MLSYRALAGVAATTLATAVHGVAHAAWPSLEDSVASARSRAPEVLEARGQLAVARSTFEGARVSVFSNPYAEVQVQHGRTDTGAFPAQINGFVFLPFDVHGQRGARVSEAERLTEWKSLGLLDAQARAVGEVIATYGEALVASQRIADATRAEEDARREVDYFAQRLSAGDATVFEKSLAEAEVARWGQTRAESQIHLVDVKASLTQLTGIAAIEPPAVDSAPPPPPLRTPYGAESAAQIVERSPLLRGVLAEAKYWDASAERWSTEKNPPLNFIVNGGYGGAGEPRVGGGLAWTFPVTRRNQGEVARAESEKTRAVTYHATARALVESRVRAAFETLEIARKAIAEQDQVGIPATARVVDAAMAAYKAGKGELLRVFIARRDLATARARRLDLVVLSWRAYGAIAALRGELP